MDLRTLLLHSLVLIFLKTMKALKEYGSSVVALTVVFHYKSNANELFCTALAVGYIHRGVSVCLHPIVLYVYPCTCPTK